MFLLALFAFPTAPLAHAQQEESAVSATVATTETTGSSDRTTASGDTVASEGESSADATSTSGTTGSDAATSGTTSDSSSDSSTDTSTEGSSNGSDNLEPNETNSESPSIPPACIATIKTVTTQTSGIDRMLSFAGKATDGPDQEDGNPSDYTIGFTVDNTQVRKGATICFFITGVNAPYIQNIEVTGYDEKAGILAWPTTFTKGWDESSKSYYYAVSFTEDVPVFTATGGRIYVTYQHGMPLSDTTIPLHISVADESTNGTAIEQKGSPNYYYMQYRSWSDVSKFYKQIAPDYSQKEGERSRIVQSSEETDKQTNKMASTTSPKKLPDP